MKDKLIKWIRDYTELTNAKGVCIRYIRRKDSSITAALLCEAIGKRIKS